MLLNSMRLIRRQTLTATTFFIVLMLTAVSAVEAADKVHGNLIMLNDNGAWSWYQDERAIVDTDAGKLLVSSVAASPRRVNGPRDGHVDLVTFELATGKRTRFVLGEIEEDDHNLAALLKRPDGRYLAIYANHNTDRLSRYRVSVRPEDSSEWTPERVFDWRETLGNDYNVTYSNLFYLSSEDKTYNFARVNDRSPNLMLSSDLGETWTYGGQLTRSADVGYVNGYFKYASNGVDTIHLIATEAHPRDFNNGVYHAYIRDGQLFGSDGTLIDDNIHDNKNIPHTNSLTPIFVPDAEDGSQRRHRGWTTDIALDENDLPYCLFTVRAGDAVPSRDGTGDDRRLYYARFDGSEWTSHEVAKMGKRLFQSEQDYTGLGALVPGDPNTIFISTTIEPVTGKETRYHEIYRGETTDGGETWNWSAVTEDSTVDNLRPIIPEWGDGSLAVLWFRGLMYRSQAYDSAIVGIIERQGEIVGKVNFVDATLENTIEISRDSTAFSELDAGSEGTLADWQEVSGFGGNGTVLTPKSTDDANQSQVLVTKLQNLDEGTYDLFAYFWSETEADGQLEAGLSPNELLSFSRTACQAADQGRFVAAQNISVDGPDVSMYRAYLGRVRVADDDSIRVFVDTPADDRRAYYDGIGYARVTPRPIVDDSVVD